MHSIRPFALVMAFAPMPLACTPPPPLARALPQACHVRPQPPGSRPLATYMSLPLTWNHGVARPEAMLNCCCNYEPRCTSIVPVQQHGQHRCVRSSCLQGSITGLYIPRLHVAGRMRRLIVRCDAAAGVCPARGWPGRWWLQGCRSAIRCTV